MIKHLERGRNLFILIFQNVICCRYTTFNWYLFSLSQYLTSVNYSGAFRKTLIICCLWYEYILSNIFLWLWLANRFLLCTFATKPNTHQLWQQLTTRKLSSPWWEWARRFSKTKSKCWRISISRSSMAQKSESSVWTVRENPHWWKSLRDSTLNTKDRWCSPLATLWGTCLRTHTSTQRRQCAKSCRRVCSTLWMPSTNTRTSTRNSDCPNITRMPTRWSSSSPVKLNCKTSSTRRMHGTSIASWSVRWMHCAVPRVTNPPNT